MSYAALSDVTVRYRPIETMIGSGQYDVSSLQVASVFISDAEGLVDGFLARRYTVPLSYCPPLITALTSDLAIHAMLAEKLPQIPEWIDKRRDRAMEILKMLAEGEMTLGNSVSTVSSQGDNFAWSPTMDTHPIFDPVLDYIEQQVDVDRVEAARNERVDDLD